VIEELAQVIAYDPYGAYTGDLSKVMRDNGQQVLSKALDIAKSAGVAADQRKSQDLWPQKVPSLRPVGWMALQRLFFGDPLGDP
jgi:hypothetical protein